MDVKSIKQVAQEQGVSYEAIRKMIVKYADPLKDHITRRGRTQYIDEIGVNFLLEHRRENPIILSNVEKQQEVEQLKAQVDLLKSELVTAQKQIIEMQAERQKYLEDKIKAELFLEERDQYKQEAESYQKSFFGFYRKRY